MKKFLAVYLGSESGSANKKWEALDEKTREARERDGMSGWIKWSGDNEKSVIDVGSPLGTTKRIDALGIVDITNQIAAYTIVQAESHDAAAQLFVKHPHFMIFPGDAVEVMECLPVPGM